MLPSIPRNKQQLRQQCRQQRDALDADFRQQASQTICVHIREWGIFKDADTIQAYLPMRSEVDLTPLLEGFPNKTWVIPRILPEGRMVFQPYDPERLVRHPFGMLEPAPDLPMVAPGSIDLALVPGLAFDRHGWRLGYGGGFFDRFLSQFRGVSLGVTFDALWLDSLPHDTHDIPMKYVATETGLIVIGRN
jgi:5-formyltetrahydrofolate cyclo-ligase